MGKVDERSRQLYFQAGREQVAPYKDRTRLFRQGEVFPGVTAVPSLGHTPGHTAYLIASGNDQLMIWGDTVHVPEVQTAFPEAGMAFDTDLAAAAASRKRMFDRVSADGILIAGMHLHFPAFLAAGAARRRLRTVPGGLGSRTVMGRLAPTKSRTI
jgi:glyoxylase-like metal-dependent hydrolase (beta-lactamase superfamily II)